VDKALAAGADVVADPPPLWDGRAGQRIARIVTGLLAGSG
jgi:hypothetical protein